MKKSSKTPARRRTQPVRGAGKKNLKRPPALEPGTKRQVAAAAFVGPAKGSKAAAMRTAGYAETTATHQQARVFDDPRVQAEINLLMDQQDLSDEKLLSKLRTLTGAKVTEFYQGDAVADCEDNKTQLDAIRLGFELRGRLNKARIEISVVVEQWTEQVVRIITQYVPVDQRQSCLDEVVGILSACGRN